MPIIAQFVQKAPLPMRNRLNGVEAAFVCRILQRASGQGYWLLRAFEQNFVDTMAWNWAQWGDAIIVEGRQPKIFIDLRDKLCMNLDTPPDWVAWENEISDNSMDRYVRGWRGGRRNKPQYLDGVKDIHRLIVDFVPEGRACRGRTRH